MSDNDLADKGGHAGVHIDPADFYKDVKKDWNKKESEKGQEASDNQKTEGRANMKKEENKPIPMGQKGQQEKSSKNN